MTIEEELQKRCDIATARLAVAEELRWLIAGLSAVIAYLKYDSWLLALVVLVAVFFAVSYLYEKEYDAAHDAYERATGTGKYWQPKRDDTA